MKIEYKGYTAELELKNLNWSSIMEGLGHTVTLIVKSPYIKGSQGLPVDEELLEDLFMEWFTQMIDETKFGNVTESM